MAHATITVRLNNVLGDVVAVNVGETGAYENVSEYLRDLIRRDKERMDKQAFDQLRAELRLSFAASESSYVSLTASDIIDRNQETIET
jgi:Arc/MetJ-type ribon-helix-helix transcriptional regulator